MILFILMIEALCTFKRELWLFLFLSHPKGCFYVISISVITFAVVRFSILRTLHTHINHDEV